MRSSGLRSALQEALSIVFPTWCAGCDAVDVLLCDACATALLPRAERRTLDGGLEVWSGIRFEGVAARALRAYKEDGRTALAVPLAAALAATPDLAADAAVAVPPSRASLRRRGFAPVELVARRAGIPLVPVLRWVRRPDDQRGLTRVERAANLAGALAASRCEGLRVVLVDDVVTSGATLTAAASALRSAGAIVLGARTVASTPRHTERVGNSSEREGDIAQAEHYRGGTQGEPQVRP
ncbi:phosphoribosyltransferase family protein [Microbacterium dauci]|uniref:Phosphoribosyltransferase family protein n=1 Tax=Microbacterium dauci TaxID=3048008 RepID=A0ABT6Z9X0_9MICO|nr:phosphoribosyltransferase family protein [Microbacterium sp. LX3-4]MDJ1112961.1 phosphoribosyltransferase family protein [Microbacterium sp. LX3-4]